MKAKIIVFAFLIFSALFLFPQKTNAQEQASGSSATLSSLLIAKEQDNRAVVLKKYLEEHNSPLADYANTFVTQADLYNLDWRFVVAISGVESTFGKEVPCTNAWGWGVYGSQTYCFSSYDEAIRTISKELRQRYIDGWDAKSVWDVGRYYAASPTWADRVVFFMNDIQQFADQQQNTPLPISL